MLPMICQSIGKPTLNATSIGNTRRLSCPSAMAKRAPHSHSSGTVAKQTRNNTPAGSWVFSCRNVATIATSASHGTAGHQ